MKNYCINLLVLAMWLGHVNAVAQISGHAWQDINGNGIVDSSEFLQGKVAVEAYDGLGKLLASSATDAKGAYTLDIPAGRRVRVSFSNLPEGFVPSLGSSTTYFATAPAQIQLPLYNPSRFTGTKPRAIQAVYALGSLENSRLNTMSSLVSYPAHPKDSVKYMPLTSFGQTGSIWGLAYDRQHQVLYSGAIAKRLSALGTQGSGGIYSTDINGNETKPFVNLDALGFSTGNYLLKRDLSSDWEVASHDSLMFSQVGKVGLGGLDISDDSRYLYTINLYDKHLYRISLKSDGPHAQHPLPVTRFPLPSNSLKGGEARPFAVKYYNGKVYVGVVCDAQQSQKAEDLQAYVYVIDGDWEEGVKGRKEEHKFKEVVHFPLNYKRGVLDYGVTGWYPWTDDYLKAVVPEQSGWMIYPQPILADIEFDTDGLVNCAKNSESNQLTFYGLLVELRLPGKNGVREPDVSLFVNLSTNYNKCMS